MKKPPVTTPFGRSLRRFRNRRGLSQLQLAVAAQTTNRHISFLETGRSRPGRELVLRLARCLELPLRDCNGLLLDAGFDPAYPEVSLDHESMRPVRAGIQAILKGHEPYPAAAYDARGAVHLSNQAFDRLFPGLAELDPATSIDRFYGVWGPAHVENWPEVAWTLVDLRSAMASRFADPELLELADRARKHLRSVPRPDQPPAAEQSPVVFARTRIEGQVVATYGAGVRFETAREASLSELRIELTFPADESSAEFFRRLARP